MARVRIFSIGQCPMCDRAKQLLGKWGIPYEEVRVDGNRAGLIEMARLTGGARNVPQFSIDGQWIGGFTELTELHMGKGLDHLVVHGSDPDRLSGSE